MLDIDHFKRVNDTCGHAAGDAVLREVVRRALGALRPYDSFGRFGGEEFLVIVPGTGDKELREVLERIRGAVGSTPIAVGKHRLTVTVSLGAAATCVGEAAEAFIASCSRMVVWVTDPDLPRSVANSYCGRRAEWCTSPVCDRCGRPPVAARCRVTRRPRAQGTRCSRPARAAAPGSSPGRRRSPPTQRSRAAPLSRHPLPPPACRDRGPGA